MADTRTKVADAQPKPGGPTPGPEIIVTPTPDGNGDYMTIDTGQPNYYASPESIPKYAMGTKTILEAEVVINGTPMIVPIKVARLRYSGRTVRVKLVNVDQVRWYNASDERVRDDVEPPQWPSDLNDNLFDLTGDVVVAGQTVSSPLLWLKIKVDYIP